MMRLLLIVWFFGAATAQVISSEIDALLTVTGTEFRKTLDALANDAPTVKRLRDQPVVGGGGNGLRRELIRQLVLARADAPEVFVAFDDLLGLIRPDTPMLEPGTWDNLMLQENGRADEAMLRHAMDNKWLRGPPANAEEWIRSYREVPPTISPPDAKRMANRFWPPIAFGLSAEPERLRKWMMPAFSVWSRQEKFGELQLEALLWLCERTDFADREIVARYVGHIEAGLEMPERDRTSLVKRHLSMLESDERFVDRRYRIEVVHGILNKTEQFGTSAHVPILRRLAEMPTWSAFQIRMLDVADKLEKAGEKPDGK